jgi:hypothetical protein
MTRWKLIFAKEWLIFILFCGGGIVSIFLSPHIGNWIIDAKYSNSLNEYHEGLRKYVLNNLNDWVPKVKAPKGDISKLDPLGIVEEALDPEWRTKIFVSDTYKKIHPEYMDWDSRIMAFQLPKLDLNSLPAEPERTSYYLPHDPKSVMIYGFLIYLCVQMLRLTNWAARNMRKNKPY